MKTTKYLCNECFEIVSLKSNEHNCPKCGKKLSKRNLLPTLSKLKNIVWRNFSKYIRLRDCLLTTGDISEGVCYTCGKKYEFSKLQAGHMVDKRTNNVLFDEDNVKIQCVSCNVYQNGKQGKFVLNRIKELQDEGYTLEEAYNYVLSAFNKEEKKLTHEDLIDLNKNYLIKIEELERSIRK